MHYISFLGHDIMWLMRLTFPFMACLNVGIQNIRTQPQALQLLDTSLYIHIYPQNNIQSAKFHYYMDNKNFILFISKQFHKPVI